METQPHMNTSPDSPATSARPKRRSVLAWSVRDVEQRLGFRGGRHTRVNNTLALLLATAATIAVYASLIPLNETWAAEMLTRRGPTPYAIVFLTCWATCVLLLKSQKVRLQRRALELSVVPENHDFVLSAITVDQVMENIYEKVDDPRHFVLFNRITLALSNLRNLGRVGDVDEILRSQAAQDESTMETSYALVRGFVWAIPVLGFIGTVLGLSQAIGGFGGVLATAEDVGQLGPALREVTGGLSTAFDTTLEALVAALLIQLAMTFLKKSEEEFLDECTEYCNHSVVSRLKMTLYEEAVTP